MLLCFFVDPCRMRPVPWQVTVACLALPSVDIPKLYLTAQTQPCIPSVSMGIVRNSLSVGYLRKPLLATLYRFMFLKQRRINLFSSLKAENGTII